MRTNIDIDDALLAETMRITGQKTKKGAIEEAMRQLSERQKRRDAIESLRGIGWEGNLDELREGWTIAAKK